MPQVRRVRGAGRAAAALWAVPLTSLLRQEVPEEGLAARRAQVGREGGSVKERVFIKDQHDRIIVHGGAGQSQNLASFVLGCRAGS